MKRILSVLMILAMVLSLLASCASPNASSEEGAVLGDLVSGSAQEDMDDSSEGPQKVENAKDPEADQGGNSNTNTNNGGNSDAATNNSGSNSNTNTNNGGGSSSSTGNQSNSGANTPSNDGGEDSDEEPAAIDPDAEDSGYLKVLSYNLRGLRNGPLIYYPDGSYQTTDVVRKNDVAQVIREIDADFVGMQELELNRDRSGNFDHVPWLAKECGYEYYYFTQTVFDKNGTSGEGHGFMSKYPIKDVKEVWYDNQDGEERKYSRAVLDVNGQEVVFYNTHLCTDNPKDVNSVSASQFKQVLRAFYNEKVPTFLTADFNIVKETRAQIVDSNRGVIAMDGGPDGCFFNDNLHIDDIYVRNAEVYVDPDTQMSIWSGEKMRGDEMPDVQPSDHYPCWGYIKIK